jgi:hypothetical protein
VEDAPLRFRHTIDVNAGICSVYGVQRVAHLASAAFDAPRWSTLRAPIPEDDWLDAGCAASSKSAKNRWRSAGTLHSDVGQGMCTWHTSGMLAEPAVCLRYSCPVAHCCNCGKIIRNCKSCFCRAGKPFHYGLNSRASLITSPTVRGLTLRSLNLDSWRALQTLTDAPRSGRPANTASA